MKINQKQILLLLIVIISAIFGFIYETIFYRFDLGYFIKRGAAYGPWLPIYAVGGLLITLSTYKYTNKHFKIFLISSIVCGILEFITGLVLYEAFNIRLWDYNLEILNFGNIGGYICLRSVLFFGISGVFLMKVVIPLLNKLFDKIQLKVLRPIVIIISTIFFIDIFLNYILLKIIN